MITKIKSSNILRGIEELVFPIDYAISFSNMPLIDKDYSELISAEYDVIIQKIDDLYFSAKCPEEIEYVFSRYFQRIERLLKELDDIVYSSVIDEIVQPAPDNLSETLFVNYYALYRAIVSLYKIFKRDYSDVIKPEGNIDLKARLFPYNSFSEMHEELLREYSADKNVVEFGDFHIFLTAELKEKIELLVSEKSDCPNELENRFDSLPLFEQLHLYFGDEYKAYFEELELYLNYSVSKKEKEFIFHAIEFFIERIETKESVFDEKFLDYLLFLAHTNIGGASTVGAIVDYFTGPNFTNEDAKMFIAKLEDPSLNKEFFEFDLKGIKEMEFLLRDKIIEVLSHVKKGGIHPETVKPLTLKISLTNFASIISLLESMQIFENTQKDIGSAFASILYNNKKEPAGSQAFIANMRSISAPQMKYLETFCESIRAKVDEKLK